MLVPWAGGASSWVHVDAHTLFARQQRCYSCWQLRPEVWSDNITAGEELHLLGCAKLELKNLLTSLSAMQLDCALILNGVTMLNAQQTPIIEEMCIKMQPSSEWDVETAMSRSATLLLGCDRQKFHGVRSSGMLPSPVSEGWHLYLGREIWC